MPRTLEIFGVEYPNATGIKATDENGVVQSYIQPDGTKTITANGTNIDVRQYAAVDVNINDSPELQNKTATYTPTESSQTDTITADTGYDGLGQVSVTVNPISSTYVGSEVTRRSSTDVTVSGPTVTIPDGYYSSSVESTISSAEHAQPTIAINTSTGVVTATHTQEAGYVAADTKSKDLSLAVENGKTITPTESIQTAAAANAYTTGQIKVAAIPSTYVGSGIDRNDSTDLSASGATVTVPAGYYASQASKSIDTGNVKIKNKQVAPIFNLDIDSNGLITGTINGSYTADATVTNGYIDETNVTNGTITINSSKTLQLTTQSAKTVTPSEQSQQAVAARVYTTGAITVAPIPDEYIVPDGTITITQNGTYDVTEKAEASVNVSASLVQRDVANTTGTTREITGDVATIVPLNVTENGMYNAPTGVTGYNPVKVSVSGASASQKAVNFIDYDGAIVESYTVEEAQSLTTLPENPSHTGLVSQGWNWSLANIKSYLTKYPDGIVNVGQMYITESGDTEIDIILDNPDYLSPYLGVCPNGTVTIDWGDGSATDTLTGTSTTTVKYMQHIYTSTGSYTIKLATTNKIGFYSSSNLFPSLLNAYISTNRQYNRTYTSLIKAIRLGENVIIGSNAFLYLTKCETITIPDSVTSIGSYAFQNCYALQTITIPDGVTSIGNSAFSSCFALQSVTIPDGVTSIENSAFSNCNALQIITIPDGVTSIGSSTFSNCYALQSITIPDGVTSIGNYAFQNCFTLQSITIPDGVTSIGSSMFSNCYALQSITIPDGVTSIGNYAFQNCFTLQSITIPDGVTSIGSSTFSNCYALQSITIPDGVTSIGNYAFQNCFTLQSITIPDGVTSIGNYAFQNCFTLQSITIPDGVTSIGNYAFQNCFTLQSITIPDGVTSIGSSAFSNCYSITEYHLKPTTPPTLSYANVFTGIVSDTIIYVPKGCLEAYQTATNWSNYASYMREEES